MRTLRGFSIVNRLLQKRLWRCPLKTMKRSIYSLSFFLSLSMLIAPFFSAGALDTYQDRNGYFTIIVPQDWKIEDSSTEDRSKVLFRSPDGKATMGVIAVLDSDNLGNLSLTKKEFVKDHAQRFPEGRFALSQETMCGFAILKVEYEIPKIAKEEFYYFFSDGVRFDLTYGTGNTEDFETYKSVALDAFCTLKIQQRMPE